MLRQLVINNLAVIDRLSLDFETGMTVLTGETGAGKSILLDALGLILGARAETGLIRGGADKTDITAIFVVEGDTALRQSWTPWTLNARPNSLSGGRSAGTAVPAPISTIYRRPRRLCGNWAGN